MNVLLYFGRQQLNSKHLDQKQQTTHSNPIKIQLHMKHIATIISQSIEGSFMLIMLKRNKHFVDVIFTQNNE